MATRLTKLRVKELSGVDDPAHKLPGWIVAKSAGWKVEVEALEKAIVSTYDGLRGEEADVYFIDAPDEVVKARELIVEHIAKDVEEDEAEEEEDVEEDAKKSVIKRVREILTGSEEVQKADEEDETEEDESAAEEDEVDETVAEEDEVDEPVAEDETEEDEPEVAEKAVDEIVEKLTSHLTETLEENISPVRDAIGAVVDRVDALEKHAAGRSSISGQDFEDAEEAEVSGLTKAIAAAAAGKKVRLD